MMRRRCGGDTNKLVTAKLGKGGDENGGRDGGERGDESFGEEKV
jgi:hypothetical protein